MPKPEDGQKVEEIINTLDDIGVRVSEVDDVQRQEVIRNGIGEFKGYAGACEAILWVEWE